MMVTRQLTSYTVCLRLSNVQPRRLACPRQIGRMLARYVSIGDQPLSQEFHTREFHNGLTLVAQRMAGVSSTAVTLHVPSGARFDPPGAEGSASILAEWCLRGAGERNTRELNDALDALGCQHHESVRSRHITFSAAQLGRNLAAVLEILADIVRAPSLGDETFGPCRDLVRQDLASLEDAPARKANMLLRERFYPSPLGRCIYGSDESLAGLSAEALRDHAGGHIGPDGVILSVAGNIDWDELSDRVGECFGDWSVPAPGEPDPQPPAGGVTHIAKDSAQTHIAMAHPTAPVAHEQYYAARMAATVLSGGMSSRLFTEVREKRGLAYHVSTQYDSLRTVAGMFTYAGTVPEKAQETFDVTIGELQRIAEGIADEEMARARTQLKSALVMQGESTAARAAAMAGDWYHLRRLRSLEELSDAIDAVTVDEVLGHLHDWPARKFTVLLIGPEPVNTAAIET